MTERDLRKGLVVYNARSGLTNGRFPGPESAVELGKHGVTAQREFREVLGQPEILRDYPVVISIGGDGSHGKIADLLVSQNLDTPQLTLDAGTFCVVPISLGLGKHFYETTAGYIDRIIQASSERKLEQISVPVGVAEYDIYRLHSDKPLIDHFLLFASSGMASTTAFTRTARVKLHMPIYRRLIRWVGKTLSVIRKSEPFYVEFRGEAQKVADVFVRKGPFKRARIFNTPSTRDIYVGILPVQNSDDYTRFLLDSTALFFGKEPVTGSVTVAEIQPGEDVIIYQHRNGALNFALDGEPYRKPMPARVVASSPTERPYRLLRLNSRRIESGMIV